MEEQSKHGHPGGNTEYWRDEQVKAYETQQVLLSEKKEEALATIVRIMKYFKSLRRMAQPRILDLGCGPGTPMTLSARILAEIPDCNLTGIDSSDQMIATARNMLGRLYGERFSGYVSNFNTDYFWKPEIDTGFDLVVSSGTLHYLSDTRRIPYLHELYEHLNDNGVFVFGVACHSHEPGISEMQHFFRAEYTYNRLGDRRPDDFSTFRSKFEETDKKANINWQSPKVWIESLQGAGFREAAMVWQLWIRGIFVALK